MTTTLEIPQALRDQAEALGVKIAPVVKYDAEDSLYKLSAQYQGREPEFHGEMGCDCFGYDATFGGFFSKINPLKKIQRKHQKKISKILEAKATTPEGKAAARKLATAKMHVDVKGSVRGLVRGVKTIGSVAAFVVPGGGAISTGLAAADKVLGDKNVKDAGKLISNTKALAALGHQDAIRGAQVLATVSRIRSERGVQPGQAAIPPVAINPKVYTRQVPAVEARALAAKAVEQNRGKKGVWVRIKEWFLGT